MKSQSIFKFDKKYREKYKDLCHKIDTLWKYN